jgi:hypothetical protein
VTSSSSDDDDGAGTTGLATVLRTGDTFFTVDLTVGLGLGYDVTFGEGDTGDQFLRNGCRRRGGGDGDDDGDRRFNPLEPRTAGDAARCFTDEVDGAGKIGLEGRRPHAAD